jgi:hypothetical protein
MKAKTYYYVAWNSYEHDGQVAEISFETVGEKNHFEYWNRTTLFARIEDAKARLEELYDMFA